MIARNILAALSFFSGVIFPMEKSLYPHESFLIHLLKIAIKIFAFYWRPSPGDHRENALQQGIFSVIDKKFAFYENFS
jgi:hypothetical protein